MVDHSMTDHSMTMAEALVPQTGQVLVRIGQTWGADRGRQQIPRDILGTEDHSISRVMVRQTKGRYPVVQRQSYWRRYLFLF